MPPPPKPAPKSWADLVRTNAAVPAAATSAASVGADAGSQSNGLFAARTSSLAEVLTSFDIKSSKEAKIAFLEPRGLVNTGNMCYMNSVSARSYLRHGPVLLMFFRFYRFLYSVSHFTIC